ncbi:dihydrodipicolinate synthase family protein [Planotetraspora sp. A-T 1434]|uniref:dihydrodipicolinate synthase family protein n=1 Tax=Planotetraspora sp. A-T 1434 TaxID=2979219 RepID=UPI0021BE3223|nr:dihydrodipicolinate synthase family protein [Planotetraspora sp. A-T 1434]MCT9931039.1 dihydrodipicolinate synthase family protein [Planotetraspora sp. A-T 1434]
MIDDVRQALRSVVAVTVTPFAPDDRIDEPAYQAAIDRLVRGGVQALTPNGNTGEFYSLSDQELTRAVTLTREAAPDAVVIAGVGHDVHRAVRLAREAQDLGCQGVMIHQPVHPYQSEEGWTDYHRAIAEAVPDLGLVCYIRSPVVTTRALQELVRHCPNVVGIKYAVPDPVAFAVHAAALSELVWVCGLAESWAPFFWAGGAEGFTSGLAVIVPELSVELLELLRAGDQAKALELWRRLKPIEDLRARNASEHNVSVIKEALAQLGVCGRAVRPPISELSPADREEVAAILRTLL